jgi:phage gpG-like protein
MAGTITIEQFNDRLKTIVRSGGLRKSMLTAALTLAKEGQRHAYFGVTNKPGGLRVRSGALRQSLGGTAKATTQGVNVILSSGIGQGFGAVPYARIHEEGLRVQVPRHTRTMLFGRRVPPFQVGPYSLKMPPRPFLKPALKHAAKHADRVISDEIARTLERDL